MSDPSENPAAAVPVELLNGPAISTLEGTEVAHIANMDTAAPGSVPRPDPVNPNPNPVHASVDVNTNLNAASVPVLNPNMVRVHNHVPHANHDHDVQELEQEQELEQPTDHPAHEHHPPPPILDHVQEVQVPMTEMSWHDFFIELQAHSTQYGTLDIEPNTNPYLEHWVAEQRSLYQEAQKGHETTLTTERRLLLDALGFDWEGVPGSDYKATDHGHENRHGAGNESSEMPAVAATGGEHEQSTMEEEEEDINVFHDFLNQLQQFKAIHGDTNLVEQDKDYEELGKWVTTQRALYEKKSLSQYRVAAMVNVGFDFAAGFMDGEKVVPSFADRIHQLTYFKQLHGHVKVSRNYAQESVNQGLGEWLLTQKLLVQRSRGGEHTSMTEERLKMLTELGLDFDEPLDISVSVRDEDAGGDDADKEPNRASKWDEKFHELKQYKLTHGHTNVPRRSKRDPSKDALGEWVHFQRRQHRNLLTGKNSTMSIARKKALDCLEFQWTRGQGPSTTTRTGTIYCTDIKEAVDVQIKQIGEKEKTESWNERFAQLEAYFRVNGNVRVPSDYRENPHLPKWLQRQKELYSIWRASLPEQHPPSDDVSLQPSQAQQEEDPRFDRQKYDKLVSLGFEFEKSAEVNVTMQDVSQGQDDVVSAPSATAPFATEEEEQPTLSDNDDVIEIFVGYEDTPPGLLEQHLEGRHEAAEHPQIHQLHPEGQQLQQQVKGEYTNEHEHHIQSQNLPNEQQPANEQEPHLQQPQMPVSVSAPVSTMPTLMQIADGTEPGPVDAEAPPAKEMELNESEIHTILEGKEENQHELGHHPVPMSAAQNHVEPTPVVDMQGVEPTDVHNDTIHANPIDPNNLQPNHVGALEAVGQIAPTNMETGNIHPNSVQRPESTNLHANAANVMEGMVHNVTMQHVGDGMAQNVTVQNTVEGTVQNVMDGVVQNVVGGAVGGMMVQNGVTLSAVEPADVHNTSAQLKQAAMEGGLNVQNVTRAEQQAVPPEQHPMASEHQLMITEQQQMISEQQQTLPAIAPVIMPRKITARVKVEWEERVLELIQFKLRKGHCNVPTKWKPNPDLADWVWKQRVQFRRYRQSQPSTLTANRISKLADLGFEFVALDHNGLPIDEVDSKLYSSSDLNKLQASKKNPPKRKGTPKSRFKEGKWLESLAKVVKYKEESGNCNVPRKWKRDPTLGEWVHFQRRQFRLRQLNRRNHMTDERIRKLEAIGFEWSRGTANQPSYIRLYEQNKELAAQSTLSMSPNEVIEGAAMTPTGVPADVSQIAIMDGEEHVKEAEEIAAVVEEQLESPEEVKGEIYV